MTSNVSRTVRQGHFDAWVAATCQFRFGTTHCHHAAVGRVGWSTGVWGLGSWLVGSYLTCGSRGNCVVPRRRQLQLVMLCGRLFAWPRPPVMLSISVAVTCRVSITAHQFLHNHHHFCSASTLARNPRISASRRQYTHLSRHRKILHNYTWKTRYFQTCKYDVRITSLVAIDMHLWRQWSTKFILNMPRKFCINPNIFQRDIEENVSGWFFSEHCVFMLESAVLEHTCPSALVE